MEAHRSRNVGILIAFQVAYLAWLLMFGRFMGGDEIAYKAPGREWARSGAFIAPELTGFAVWRDPKHPYEMQRGFGPPLFTFSFGLFVKVFGFNPVSNVAFDGLIHILLGWATWTLARALGPRLPYEAAMIAAAATIPLTTGGRPDELGALLAMFGSAILLRRVTTGRAAAAGILFGLSGGTSLVAGIILLVWPARAFRQQRDTGWKPLGVFLFCGVLTFAIVMTPLILITPYGLQQLWRSTRTSVSPTHRWAFEFALRYGRSHYLACCAALVIATAHAVHVLRQRDWGRWLELWIPPLAALCALLVLLPVKYYYIWIVDLSLFAAAACAMAMLPWRVRTRAFVVALAMLFWCAASSRFVLMSLVRATLPPDQRMTENVALLHRMIPAGSGVMTYDFWPALAGSSYRTYSTEADPPWSDVDYIVLTGNGSGVPGQPQTLRPEQLGYVNTHYVTIYNNINRRPFRLGPIHTNSAWGYGPLILKRNDARR